jgi:hypothetical protein
VEAFYREIIVGLEINKLNSPHFVKTIGFATTEECDIPVKVNPGTMCIYLYVEKIDGPTFWDYIQTAKFSDFKSVVIQLLEGYAPALKQLNFTHYDFHPKNVIIRKKNGVPTVPVIIDFGASHISLVDGDIGENTIMFARYPDRSLWVQDFFKLFAMLWSLTSSKRLSRRKTKIGLSISEITEKEIRDKETYNDYINRIKKFIGPEYNAILNEIKKEETFVKKDNTKRINAFILKMLKYFYPLDDEWLINYEEIDPFFGVYPSQRGECAKFPDFVKYVKGLK